MSKEEISKLSDEQLVLQEKELKRNKIFLSVLIGVLIGIAIYSFAKNGFSLFTALALVFLIFLLKNNKDSKEVLNEVEKRNLKKSSNEDSK